MSFGVWWHPQVGWLVEGLGAFGVVGLVAVSASAEMRPAFWMPSGWPEHCLLQAERLAAERSQEEEFKRKMMERLAGGPGGVQAS